MKKIYFTVTNDLTYDQRMHRICTTLAEHGYDITLVGRRLPGSAPLAGRPFKQRRLYCWFTRGKLFYAEYNMRLFFFLLFRRMDAVCAIDLDTILPCLWISCWKKIPRIYDAHELFTELKEVVTRPQVQRAWNRIAQYAIPRFKHGYTVCESLAEELRKRYQVQYEVIRNMPVLKTLTPENSIKEPFILYSGAVNEGRGFEYLIPAMQWVNSRLVICGDGNFMPQLRVLIDKYNMNDKIELKGMVSPGELWHITCKAAIGMAIAENQGLNQYLALPNKFFDYIQAGLPQITMSFPEYRNMNACYEVAVLIEDLSPERIADAINNLMNDIVLYNKLRDNCLKARLELNWQQEEKKLLSFYQSLFSS